jgi:hypothetical protein
MSLGARIMSWFYRPAPPPEPQKLPPDHLSFLQRKEAVMEKLISRATRRSIQSSERLAEATSKSREETDTMREVLGGLVDRITSEERRDA